MDEFMPYLSSCSELGPQSNGSWLPFEDEIVNRFAGIDVLAELDGTNGHRLSNVLTLSLSLRQLFDGLSLWFEAVPDAPTIKTNHPFGLLHRLPKPLVVTFTATAANLELPNPEYLKLHAMVCRVANISGVVGYLHSRDREAEERQVMAHDGSSADLLASRLSRVVLVA